MNLLKHRQTDRLKIIIQAESYVIRDDDLFLSCTWNIITDLPYTEKQSFKPIYYIRKMVVS